MCQKVSSLTYLVNATVSFQPDLGQYSKWHPRVMADVFEFVFLGLGTEKFLLLYYCETEVDDVAMNLIINLENTIYILIILCRY